MILCSIIPDLSETEQLSESLGFKDDTDTSCSGGYFINKILSTENENLSIFVSVGGGVSRFPNTKAIIFCRRLQEIWFGFTSFVVETDRDCPSKQNLTVLRI